LPVEITQMILLIATKSPDNSIVSHVVCRFVCQQWKALLPIPSAKLFASFLRKTVRSGWLSILQWTKEENHCPFTDISLCPNAAKKGNIEVLKWLREIGCSWDQVMCTKAAVRGNLAMLKWLRKQRCPWNRWTCDHAASKGHLEVLKWLRENDCPWSSDVCDSAAA